MSKIMETVNYELFELSPFNRDIRRIERIKASMRKHGWLDAYPMHVTLTGKTKPKFTIKGGHHRHAAAVELGIPVKYVVCDDDATVFELEMASNVWTTKNYMEAYARQGRADYAELQAYHERTGIGVTTCIAILGGVLKCGSSKLTSFKRGEFRVVTPEVGETTADMLLAVREVYPDLAVRSSFILALLRLQLVDEFNANTFKSRVKKYGASMLKNLSTINDNVAMIEELYNYHTPNKMPLAFMADRAARDRVVAPAPWTTA